MKVESGISLACPVGETDPVPPLDTKTSEAIAVVRNDIRRVELSIRAEITKLHDDLRTIEADLAALDAKIERLRLLSDLP